MSLFEIQKEIVTKTVTNYLEWKGSSEVDIQPLGSFYYFPCLK
ncbi:hypothetical protein Xen7305DRAFT_00020250 [Xenococcus sp. PCC 7305]|nr:hypothetical protein Xen7305DRAFT_00020250 [Xenococcus sp. PCC 7305]